MLASRWLAALLTTIIVVAAACSGTGTSSSAPSASPGAPATSTAAPVATATPAATPTPITVLDGEPWIAFTWAPDQGRGLYLVRPDGTDAHEIALDLPGQPEIPDWSPDGTLIALNLKVSDGVFEIWTVKADGTDPQRLLGCDAAPCVEVGNPSWSPDGKQLVIGRKANVHGVDGDYRDNRYTIEVFDLATRTSRVIAASPAVGAEYSEWTWPRWSPDGTEVVFAIDRYPMPPTDENRLGGSIAVVKADGSEVDAPRILTEPAIGGSYPDWSPDGQRIVFFAYGPGWYQQTTNATNLFTIRPDGTGLTQVTQLGENQDQAVQPTWTPDGSRIIFAYFRRNPSDPYDRGLAFIDPDGSNLTFLDRAGTHPRLRPTP